MGAPGRLEGNPHPPAGKAGEGRRGRSILRSANIPGQRGRIRKLMPFRIPFFGLAFVWLAVATAQAEPAIRVGSLRYGTLSWELDVIAQHGLSEKHDIRIDAL